MRGLRSLYILAALLILIDKSIWAMRRAEGTSSGPSSSSFPKESKSVPPNFGYGTIALPPLAGHSLPGSTLSVRMSASPSSSSSSSSATASMAPSLGPLPLSPHPSSIAGSAVACLGSLPAEKAQNLITLSSQEGSEDEVRALLATGANVEGTDQYGWTALMRAAASGQESMVKLLLRAGARVTPVTQKGATALMYAAQSGHVGITSLLLGAGADVKAAAHDGFTAVDYATHNNHHVLAQMLKDWRAQPLASIATSSSLSPAIMAAPPFSPSKREAKPTGGEAAVSSSSYSSIVIAPKLAVHLGSLPADWLKRLIQCAQENDMKQMDDLLRGGADVNQANEDKRTALMEAAQAGYEGMINDLLGRGAHVDQRDKDDMTALMFAAQKGHGGIVQLLLGKQAKADTANKDGQTALMWLAGCGQLAAVKLLLERGADVNQSDGDGFTPLMWAAQGDNLGVVKWLLGKGANPDKRNNRNEKALDIAEHQKHLMVVHELYLWEPKLPCPLVANAHKGDGTTVEPLLDNGAQVHAVGKEERTSLLGAASSGHTDGDYQEVVCIKEEWAAKQASSSSSSEKAKETLSDDGDLLIGVAQGEIKGSKGNLRAGAGVDTCDSNGLTDLILAARQGDAPRVQLLLNSGADVNAANEENGITALMEAAWGGYYDCVAELLSQGAHIEARDKDGDTALIVAAWKGHPLVVKLLLEKKAKVNAANKSGHTALARATEKGHAAVIALLQGWMTTHPTEIEGI